MRRFGVGRHRKVFQIRPYVFRRHPEKLREFYCCFKTEGDSSVHVLADGGLRIPAEFLGDVGLRGFRVLFAVREPYPLEPLGSPLIRIVDVSLHVGKLVLAPLIQQIGELLCQRNTCANVFS